MIQRSASTNLPANRRPPRSLNYPLLQAVTSKRFRALMGAYYFIPKTEGLKRCTGRCDMIHGGPFSSKVAESRDCAGSSPLKLALWLRDPRKRCAREKCHAWWLIAFATDQLVRRQP